MMQDLMNFLSSPAGRAVLKALLGYFVFSALVGALPEPEQGGSKLYAFGFRFAHGLAGNLDRAAKALKVPGAQN